MYHYYYFYYAHHWHHHQGDVWTCCQSNLCPAVWSHKNIRGAVDEPLDRRQTEAGSSIFLSSDHNPSTPVSFPFFFVSLVVSPHPVIFSYSVLAFFFSSLSVSMTWVFFSLPACEVLISTSATRADNDTFTSSFHIRLEWVIFR